MPVHLGFTDRPKLLNAFLKFKLDRAKKLRAGNITPNMNFSELKNGALFRRGLREGGRTTVIDHIHSLNGMIYKVGYIDGAERVKDFGQGSWLYKVLKEAIINKENFEVHFITHNSNRQRLKRIELKDKAANTYATLWTDA